MVNITQVIQLIFELFVNYIFGSPILVGMAAVAFFVAWGLKQKWTTDSFIVVLTPLLIFLGVYALPLNFKVLIAVVGGAILATTLYKIARG